jgi:hypothetical protein
MSPEIIESDPGFEVVSEAELEQAPQVLPLARRVSRRRYEAERLTRWVRGFLIVLALGLMVVFGIAIWLNPYHDDGSRRAMATHMQLGLEPCNMVVLFDKPCPACGMTTSFAMLMHGDIVGSVQANWVGTLLALTWLTAIPWSIASAMRARYYFIRSGELLFTVLISTFMVLMIARWGVVVLT